MIKVFKGDEARYQKIKRLALTARKLRPYFHVHQIFVKTYHLICQVIKKPNLAGKMMSWTVELYEYNIHYIPRGSINSQVLIDFLVKFSMPIGYEVSPA